MTTAENIIWSAIRLVQDAQFDAERMTFRDVPSKLKQAQELLLSLVQKKG